MPGKVPPRLFPPLSRSRCEREPFGEVGSRRRNQPCWFAVATLTMVGHRVSTDGRNIRRFLTRPAQRFASLLQRFLIAAGRKASEIAITGAVAIRAVGARELYALLSSRGGSRSASRPCDGLAGSQAHQLRLTILRLPGGISEWRQRDFAIGWGATLVLSKNCAKSAKRDGKRQTLFRVSYSHETDCE